MEAACAQLTQCTSGNKSAKTIPRTAEFATSVTAALQERRSLHGRHPLRLYEQSDGQHLAPQQPEPKGYLF
jgi:hypothetical protein